MLISSGGAVPSLRSLRDETLDQLYDLYKNGATKAQRDFIDSLVTSQQQVRGIDQDLMARLATIDKTNSSASQITAIVTLIQMKVSPVFVMHIPFGGDNHNDPDLDLERDETVSGVATIAALMEALAAAGLQDQVTFMTLNVFGRTLLQTGNGRDHNGNHQVSITIGKPFRAGVIGGVMPVGKDYGCTSIDSRTGKGVPNGGDVAPTSTLASFAQTVLAGVGVAPDVVSSLVTAGQVITAGLA
jgi:hypothetical protein